MKLNLFVDKPILFMIQFDDVSLKSFKAFQPHNEVLIASG